MKIEDKLQLQPDYKPLFLLSAIGLLLFLTVTFTYSFRDKVFQAFFKRPLSLAQTTDDTPTVELVAGSDNIFRRGFLNVENNKLGIILKWKTGKSPKSCSGRFWSNVKSSDPWTGEKSEKGGEYAIAEPVQTGIYVYSVNCLNESGDSSGSTVVINVGAKTSYLQPHITLFQASSEDTQYEIGKLNSVPQNTKVTINWAGLNTDTAFGVCTASGSWSTIYTNSARFEVNESFVLDKQKIYKYSLLCSNENGVDNQEISFMVR